MSHKTSVCFRHVKGQDGSLSTLTSRPLSTHIEHPHHPARMSVSPIDFSVEPFYIVAKQLFVLRHGHEAEIAGTINWRGT